MLEYGVIWTPEFRFRNGFDPRIADNIRIYMFYDGTVYYRERFTAQLMEKFHLEMIPFDSQTLTMDIGSLTFDDDFLLLLEESETVKVDDDFSFPSWTLKSVNQEMLQ